MPDPAPELKYLIWIDLEMSGLDPKKDRILEIATVVTDLMLNVIARGPDMAISQPDDLLETMNSWCKTQHKKSGLIERVRESDIDERQAELLTLEFLAKYVEPGSSPMCGNTIWQDRRFLAEYMPALEGFFHYRQLDVSTLKILAKMWRPEVVDKIKKTDQHLALSDILESIEELKTYRELLFKV